MISDTLKKIALNLNAVADKFESDKDKKKEKLMAETTLQDGTPIMTDADAFADGVAVFTTNENGESIPLGDGEYVLADGRVMAVSEGVISSLREAEGESEESDLRSLLTKQNEVIAELAAEINELKSVKTDLSELASLNEKHSELLTKLSSQVVPSVKDEAPEKVELSKEELDGLTPAEQTRLKIQKLKNAYSK